jgi:preprotein translocase SecE subunit
MKAKKSLALFLVSCLVLCAFFCLGVAAADAAEAANEGISTFALVSIIIGGVVLVLVTVLCIVKRQKLAESLRAYKRELKNVTWFSWKNVWRSTVFVIVAIVVVAAVIGLLDYAFFQGQYLLVDLLGGK